MLYVVTGCFALLDFGTGMVQAIKNKNFSSSVMREGLYHKCSLAFFVIFGLLVDYAQTLIDLGVQVPLTIAICSYIILMECGSIMENLGKINPALVPVKIREHFVKLNE